MSNADHLGSGPPIFCDENEDRVGQTLSGVKCQIYGEEWEGNTVECSKQRIEGRRVTQQLECGQIT